MSSQSCPPGLPLLTKVDPGGESAHVATGAPRTIDVLKHGQPATPVVAFQWESRPQQCLRKVFRRRTIRRNSRESPPDSCSLIDGNLIHQI